MSISIPCEHKIEVEGFPRQMVIDIDAFGDKFPVLVKNTSSAMTLTFHLVHRLIFFVIFAKIVTRPSIAE